MTHSAAMSPDIFSEWLAALEARHLADLRVPEVTRALRALSSAYVERRHALSRGAALDSHGKRAAFALFYAPLHFMTVHHIVTELGAHEPPVPRTIADLGCGTGAAGAAWAVAAGRLPRIVGLDRHPWAVDEARWTYAQLKLDGHARQADLAKVRVPGLPRRNALDVIGAKAGAEAAVVAAYTLNELPDAAREPLLRTLFDAARSGARILIVEPISRAVTPWWEDATERARTIGGRADEWRITLDLPPMLALFDKSAGLNHRELKARSLALGLRH